MFRPLIVDLQTLLLPVGVGLLAFLGGRSFRRWPRWLQIGALGLAAVMVASGIAAMTGLLSDDITTLLSLVGGVTVLLCWAALLIFGIAWRRTDASARVS
jgi:hypothetical protein